MHIQKWKDCLRIIKDNLEEQPYRAFFEPIKPISLKQNVLTLEVPNSFFCEIIEGNFIELLKWVIRKEIGPTARLEYSIPIGKSNTRFPGGDGKREYDNQIPVEPIRNPFVLPGLKKLNISSQLNYDYSRPQ